MIGPYVSILHYRIMPHEWVVFQSPPPRDWTTPEFHAHLENDHVTVTMMRRCATGEEARSVVDPQLKAWSIKAGCEHGYRG
jgi:hypothetical protein